MKRSLVLALGLTLAACGNGSGENAPPATPSAPGEHAGEHAGEPAHGPVKAPGDANVGDTSTCPVSGEEFVVNANSPKAEYNGKTYYFCCSGCQKKFEENPSKFLNPS